MKYNLAEWPRWLRDFVPLIVWMALIFALSSRPALVDIENEAGEILLFKLAHLMVYAILGWLWWRVLAPRRQPTGASLFMACTLTILYGVSDEIHQLYVPGRYGRVADVLFDTAGVVLMIVLLRRLPWLRLFPEMRPFASRLATVNRQSELS